MTGTDGVAVAQGSRKSRVSSVLTIARKVRRYPIQIMNIEQIGDSPGIRKNQCSALGQLHCSIEVSDQDPHHTTDNYQSQASRSFRFFLNISLLNCVPRIYAREKIPNRKAVLCCRPSEYRVLGSLLPICDSWKGFRQQNTSDTPKNECHDIAAYENDQISSRREWRRGI